MIPEESALESALELADYSSESADSDAYSPKSRCVGMGLKPLLHQDGEYLITIHIIIEKKSLPGHLKLAYNLS